MFQLYKYDPSERLIFFTLVPAWGGIWAVFFNRELISMSGLIGMMSGWLMVFFLISAGLCLMKLIGVPGLSRANFRNHELPLCLCGVVIFSTLVLLSPLVAVYMFHFLVDVLSVF